jgi:hypothetical protein
MYVIEYFESRTKEEGYRNQLSTTRTKRKKKTHTRKHPSSTGDKGFSFPARPPISYA